jgi:hypothetical protein
MSSPLTKFFQANYYKTVRNPLYENTDSHRLRND